MRREPVVTWVVYEKQMPGKPKVTVMCEQSEWDALELTQPNPCTLVRAGITNEGEAERLARSGAVVVKVKERSRPVPPAAEALPSGPDTRHAAMATFCEQARRAAAAERPCQESVVRG
jgi:hypothetical protein